MRILILTPQLPFPPRQGTALRNWGILSGLARNHEVWLLSFDEQTSDSAAALAPELQAACRQVAVFPVPRRSTSARLRTLTTSSLPDMAWRLWSPAFAARFDEWTSANSFDVIQIEGIELARYALQLTIPSARFASGQTVNRQSSIVNRKSSIVFDDHNCEYLLQRRACETDLRQPRRWHAAAYSFVQWQRLRSFERRIARRAGATLVVSPQDAAALRRLDVSLQPQVIFNGIDVASYAAIPQREVGDEGAVLVFTGKMDFRPNVDAMLWFAHEVFPRIRQAMPQARVLVVGQRPSPRLDVLRADPAFTITGAVDDVRPYIAQADVYIAPLRVGGGTRFKLLEAMAMQRAIVSTTLGCEGFDVASGRELAIADAPADFAAAVVSLLRDGAARRAMGRRALDFVSASYDWRVIVPRLEDVYATLGATTAS